MRDKEKWLRYTEKDLRRLQEKRPATLVGILFYGGTLGVLFVLPVVGGAYLGRWLDTLNSGYSVRWTISLIVLGVAVGAFNVTRFVRGKV